MPNQFAHIDDIEELEDAASDARLELMGEQFALSNAEWDDRQAEFEARHAQVDLEHAKRVLELQASEED